jgi:DNA-directed RNA polymerase alpha subunit
MGGLSFEAGTRDDPRTIAILDEQIAALEELVAALKGLRRGGDRLIDELILSPRTSNCLRRNIEPPVKYLSQVAAMSKFELMRIPNFGRRSYRELWEICVELGFWNRNSAAYRPDGVV